MRNKFLLFIVAFIFAFIFISSFASAFLISDQGTDVKDVATGFTSIAALNTGLLANNNYTFDCKIIFMTNATSTGIGINMLASAAPTMISYDALIPFAADAAAGTWHGAGTSSNDTIISTSVEAVNTNYTMQLLGTVGVGASGITIQPTFRSEVSNKTTVQPRSYCRWVLLNG